MTTSPHAEISHLIENATRQAKRLRLKLDIPLNEARMILAKGPYRCSSWDDLRARLNIKQATNHTHLLASLPESDTSNTYFLDNIDKLARSLKQHILPNTNLLGLYELLRHVFGLPDTAVTLADVVTTLPVTKWQSSNIGPDPEAVIHAFTVINNVTMKLIATRVYMPEYYNFENDEKLTGKDAEPYGENYKIIWSNPHAWYKTTLDYLKDEDDLSEINLPKETMDADMEEHALWFKQASVDELKYGEEYFHTVPYVLPLGCYLIFGFPTAAQIEIDNIHSTAIPLPITEDEENKSQLILIGKQPLRFEWIRVDRQSCLDKDMFDEYFNLVDGLFRHKNCDLDEFSKNNWCNSYFYLTPPTTSDIEQQLKTDISPEPNEDLFVIKSDHLSIAVAALDKVAACDMLIFRNILQEQSYLIEMDIEDNKDFRSFSIGINIVGENTWRSASLITTAYFWGNDNNKKLYLVVEPRLFSLIELLGIKTLKKAIKYGIVQHQKAGFFDLLNNSTPYCKNLDPADKEIVEVINKPLDISWFDLWKHSRKTIYERDNY